MSAYQTYLKNCDCSTEGIIIYNNKAVCRRCRKPYAQGNVINYDKAHFEEVKPDYEIKCWDIVEGKQCIYEVLRLSDNEVFSVGDEIATGKIISFSYLKETGLFIEVDTRKLTYYYPYRISEISKVKPKIPLFTTEDGVQLFKGDSYVKLNDYSDWSIVIGFIAEGNGDMYKGLKFSTKEAAEKYILLNKPIEITQKEIMGAIKSACSYTFITIDAIAELFKSKIKL